jgi:hypothetical protein
LPEFCVLKSLEVIVVEAGFFGATVAEHMANTLQHPIRGNE